MLKAIFRKHTFHFRQPGGTSRGVLNEKDSWHIKIYHDDEPEIIGLGECSLIPKLSIDDRPDFEEKLRFVIENIDKRNGLVDSDMNAFPAIRFGLETSLIDLNNGGKRSLFPSAFTQGKAGIPINGLVWMGSYEFMKKQIIEKIESGFRCIKLKIGAIDFDAELKLLKMIRNDFNEKELELRVDANGAFSPEDAMEKLNLLSQYQIHSIEQPIRQKQLEEMAALCEETPIPIALDEELIGITDALEIDKMLSTIKPQYIILKPGLLGGFKQSEAFIQAAEKLNIGWWVTSALEGNIGLNAIAQWTATLNNSMPQGLGTGQLFTNNIPSPLKIENAHLYYDPSLKWDLDMINDG